MRIVHDLGTADDTRQRQPACHRLRNDHEVGLDAEVLHREHSPSPPEPGLHLVRHEQDAFPVADSAQAFHELRGRGQEAALALLRLEHDRRDVFRRHRRHEQALEGAECGCGVRAAIGIRVRRAVDLGRKGPQPLLVRMRLRGHGQGHPRPAVECALEREDRLSLRVEARELDGVLDRLGAGVEERSTRLPGDRSQRAETLSELDVALVRDDREIRVEKPVGLLGDRFDDAWIVVADVRHADASDEVDERVAVDVGDGRPARAIGDDRLVDDQRTGDSVPLALEDLAATRAGNLGANLDDAGGGSHAREPIRPTCR